jgi:hypothetical protein
MRTCFSDFICVHKDNFDNFKYFLMKILTGRYKKKVKKELYIQITLVLQKDDIKD